MSVVGTASVEPRGVSISGPAAVAPARTPRRGAEAVVLAATAAVAALNYAYTLLMIWLLPPTQYAVVGSISALLLIFGTVAGASVPWVLAREVATSGHDAEIRRRAVGFSVAATLIQATGAAIATCLVAARYAAPATLTAAFVAVIVIFAASTTVGYLQGQLRFRLIAVLRVTEVVVKILAAAVLVLAGNGAEGAIAGFAAGALIVAMVGGACMRADMRRVRGAVFDRRLWSATVGLLSIQGGVAVLASLDVVVASLALGASATLATYQAANVLGRAALFVGASLSIIVFPRVAAAIGSRPADIRASLRLYLRIAIPTAAVIATTPTVLVVHLFPASYGNIARVLPVAAAAGLALGLVNLVTTYFQATGRIRRTTITLGIGIVASGALELAGLQLAGPRGLAAGVAAGALLIAVSLLRDCARIWPGCLRSVVRTAAVGLVLAVPLCATRGSGPAWAVAVLVCAAVPVADALRRAGHRDMPGRPRRVLHLGYEDPRRPGSGGGSVRTHAINRRLAARYEITVVCAAYPGAVARVEDGVRYRHAGFRTRSRLGILSYFALIPYILWRYPSDLVVEDFGAPFSSVAVPWLTDRPTIGVVQWLFAEQKRDEYRVPFHLVERIGVRSHRRLIAVSEEFGQMLAARNPRAEVAVVPNGLDAHGMTPRHQPRTGIAYLGRIEIAQKGIDMLLTSYATIAGDVDHDVLIGGDGPDRDVLEALAADLGVGDRVHFVGRVAPEDRFAWLAGAALLAMPSRYETFGMVAAEALSVATPVVAFDIPCLRGVVDLRAGVLVPAFDLDRYSQALRSVALDQALARRLGRCGPGAVAGLEWDALAARQGDLYDATLHGLPFADRLRTEPDRGPTPHPAPFSEAPQQ